jgi:hypothetical protein
MVKEGGLMLRAGCLLWLIAVLVWVTACKRQETARPAGPVTARLTWKEYDGAEEPERAVYYLDGRRIGRGTMGFMAVMLRLRELPVGSTMEVFSGFPKFEPSGPDRVEPFSQAFGDGDDTRYGVLRQVTRERKIRVTLDGRDYPIDDRIDW